MPHTATTQTQIDDATLLTRLRRLVSQDRATSARMLWHLAEVDARGLCRDEGYSSLFDYCVKRLHMSENYAKGGFATVENVRLLCRSHNALLAERDFGRELILQRRHGKPVNPPTVPEPSPG